MANMHRLASFEKMTSTPAADNSLGMYILNPSINCSHLWVIKPVKQAPYKVRWQNIGRITENDKVPSCFYDRPMSNRSSPKISGLMYTVKATYLK